MSTTFEPGTAPDGFVPLCIPHVQGNEWAYVKECIDTNFVSSVGPFVDRFERELAAKVGAAHAVATTSGTAALHVALLVAGVQADDEVLVSDLTFIAPANAIRYAGAWPVFIDAEPKYWQMDPEKVSDFLTRECTSHNGALTNKRTGRRVKAIIPVHVLGHPVEMTPILELARRYELTVIEDATESLGATYRGKPTGALGDIGCFSFNGNKILTTGGGGMLITNRSDLAKQAKYLTTQAKDDPLEYVHNEIGYNYRLTNIQAAFGVAQLEQLDHYVARKCEIAERYREALNGVPGITCMQQAPWAASSSWLFTILVDARSYGIDSRQLLRELGSAKVQTRPLWQPMHRSRAHATAQAYRCEVSDWLNRDGLSLPCSVGLAPVEQQRVIDHITRRSP
jgi:perosamine synthetase